MDDFKATGPQAELNWVRSILSTAFGGDVNMLQDNTLIHTGIRHTRIQEKDLLCEFPPGESPSVAVTFKDYKTLESCKLRLS